MRYFLVHLGADEIPQSKFNEDDALVFYTISESEILEIKNRILGHSISLEKPKNPYWKKNAIMISDPDGFKIIFTVRT